MLDVHTYSLFSSSLVCLGHNSAQSSASLHIHVSLISEHPNHCTATSCARPSSPPRGSSLSNGSGAVAPTPGGAGLDGDAVHGVPGTDRVSRSNPGGWLILRPVDGTLKPWGRSVLARARRRRRRRPPGLPLRARPGPHLLRRRRVRSRVRALATNKSRLGETQPNHCKSAGLPTFLQHASPPGLRRRRPSAHSRHGRPVVAATEGHGHQGPVLRTNLSPGGPGRAVYGRWRVRPGKPAGGTASGRHGRLSAAHRQLRVRHQRSEKHRWVEFSAAIYLRCSAEDMTKDHGGR